MTEEKVKEVESLAKSVLTEQEKKELSYHQREADREAARLRKERQEKQAYEMQVKMRLAEAKRAREEQENRGKATSQGPEIDIMEAQRLARKRREEMKEASQAKRLQIEKTSPPLENATTTTTTTTTPTTNQPTNATGSASPTSPTTRGGKIIQIRLPPGSASDTVKAEFEGAEPLKEVYHYVASHLAPGFSFKLTQVYPKVEFDKASLSKTLDELGLQSRVSLAVVAIKGKSEEVKAADKTPEKSGPKVNYTERISGTAEEESCLICQCPYEEGEILRKLPCQHEYHKECLAEWQSINATCPLCTQ